MDIRNRKKLEREKLYNLFYDYKKAIKVIESMKYVSNVECTVKYCNALVRKHLYANNLVGIDKPFKRFMFYMSGCLKCKNIALKFSFSCFLKENPKFFFVVLVKSLNDFWDCLTVSKLKSNQSIVPINASPSFEKS